MRKLFLALFIAFSSLTTQAGNAELFTYDEQQLNQEFGTLNAVEDYVIQNEGATMADVKANTTLIAGDENPESFQGMASTLRGDGPPLGIPSFIWGCVLGWIGILIVYFIAEDRDETKKAFYGCLIGWGVGFIIYLIVWVVVLGSSFGSF